jgi:hypothetical protein
MFRDTLRCAALVAGTVSLILVQSSFELAPSAQVPAPLRVDLLWQSTSGGLSVWEMDGTTRIGEGGLTPSQLADANWKMVGSGDFNGDSQHDLIWHHQTNGSLAVWFMNGSTMTSGEALVPGVVADTNWKVRAVGDLNNDAKPDLIWQNQSTGYISAWLMNGKTQTSGPLLYPTPIDVNWHVVGVGDTNGDQLSDLL